MVASQAKLWDGHTHGQHLQKRQLVAPPGKNKILVSGAWFLSRAAPEFSAYDHHRIGGCLCVGKQRMVSVTEKPHLTAAQLTPVTWGVWKQEGHQLHPVARAGHHMSSPALISGALFSSMG